MQNLSHDIKLKIKKRIAKEIIILLSGFLLALIIFLLVYPYNWIYESKVRDIEKSIISKQKQADSLYAEFKNIISKNRITGVDKDIPNDISKFSKTQQFHAIVHGTTPVFGMVDMRNTYSKAPIAGGGSYLTDDYKYKILSFEEQKDFGVNVFIIILIILYPLRILYLLIIWSIKTIKQKEN